MLYFIKSSNFLKIGYSENMSSLIKRIKAYRTHNPDFTILQIVSNGSKSDEIKLHHILRDYQYYTEWFYDSQYVHNIWNNYTKDMKKLNVDEIISKSLDKVQYCPNKVLAIKEELEDIIGDELYCKDSWEYKDIMNPLYRKYKKKGAPILSDLKKFGYDYKRIKVKGVSYIKIYKIDE